MTSAAATLDSQRPEGLARAVRSGRIGAFSALSDFAACMMPLLSALGWRGDPRHVMEALPHFANSLDLIGFRNALANLNYTSRPLSIALDRLDPRLMPCLFVPQRGPALAVLERVGDTIQVFDGSANDVRWVSGKEMPGTAYLFTPMEEEKSATPQQDRATWFGSIAERFRGLIYQLLGVTFLLNLLALVTPLFVMAVYDRVIASGSKSTLYYLAAGVVIALVFDLSLRAIRARMLAYIGARIDMIVGIAIFQQILYLPPLHTERATIGAQVARLKEFESVREFFTGPLALVFLELPFVPLLIITISLIAGPLAFVPVFLIALFAVIGFALLPLIRGSVSDSTRAGANRQGFLVEALSRMRAIKLSSAETTWRERYRSLSAKAAFANFRTAQYASLVQTLSHLLMISSGVATLAFGTYRVLAGDMTTGALVASMALVWRVLSPLQTCFVTVTRLEQVRAGIRQINQLMRLKPERDPFAPAPARRKFLGQITFSHVSLRYLAEAEPALMGVSFDIAPGEVIALIGPNGSGKSTVLKLIAGIYQPQAGTVRIDGMDIRQLDPIELRQSIGQLPQVCHLFHGTIAQNLRLADPTATDEDLQWAATQANALDHILTLSEGFDTRTGDQALRRMSSGFLQRLQLARAYLRRASILLVDEPGNALDADSDRAFMNAVEAMRGQTTVLMATHRPSHMRMADRVIVLENGLLRFAGPPDEVLPRLPKNFL